MENESKEHPLPRSGSSLDEHFANIDLLLETWSKKGNDRVVCNQCKKEKYRKKSNGQLIVVKG